MDQKVGEDRLSSSSKFGLTLIIGSFVFLLMIILIAAFLIVRKLYNRVNECSKKLK